MSYKQGNSSSGSQQGSPTSAPRSVSSGNQNTSNGGAASCPVLVPLVGSFSSSSGIQECSPSPKLVSSGNQNTNNGGAASCPLLVPLGGSSSSSSNFIDIPPASLALVQAPSSSSSSSTKGLRGHPSLAVDTSAMFGVSHMAGTNTGEFLLRLSEGLRSDTNANSQSFSIDGIPNMRNVYLNFLVLPQAC